MKTRLAALTVALMAVAGVAQAQSGPLLDANGRPYVTNGPQVGPGDYTRERPGLQPPDSRSMTASPARGSAQHGAAFKDEYGFRYDDRGDRIDGAGHRISPHTMTP
jgi:hypothetical protein